MTPHCRWRARSAVLWRAIRTGFEPDCRRSTRTADTTGVAAGIAGPAAGEREGDVRADQTRRHRRPSVHAGRTPRPRRRRGRAVSARILDFGAGVCQRETLAALEAILKQRDDAERLRLAKMARLADRLQRVRTKGR